MKRAFSSVIAERSGGHKPSTRRAIFAAAIVEAGAEPGYDGFAG